ncbi:zf-HC2 domain-containing protein [Paenibacillus hodogayensis]
MELMQRHLDHDLNDEEQKAMRAHMQQCPDCEEMFTRLQQLSQELASLPKVTPPFSLVDSILPQLAEIDRDAGRPAVSAAAIGAAEPVGIPMTTERPSRFRAAWSMAAAGGIVAAGLLLAIFISDMDGTKVAEDSQLLPQAGRSESSSSAQDRVMSKSNAKEEQKSAQEATPDKADTDMQTSQNAPKETEGADAGPASGTPVASGTELAPAAPPLKLTDQTSAQKEPARSEEPASGGGELGKSLSAPAANTDDFMSNAKDAGQNASTGSGSSGSTPPSSGMAAGETPKTPVPEEAPPPAASESKAPLGGETGFGFASSQETKSADGGSATGGSAAGGAAADTKDKSEDKASPERRPTDKSQGVTQPPGMAGLMAIAGEQLVSEDGVLVASIDASKRWIVVTTADEKRTQMFISASWGPNETAKLVQWKGSAQLTYTIASGDGKTTKTMVIDIARNKESVQEPKA